MLMPFFRWKMTEGLPVGGPEGDENLYLDLGESCQVALVRVEGQKRKAIQS